MRFPMDMPFSATGRVWVVAFLATLPGLAGSRHDRRVMLRSVATPRSIERLAPGLHGTLPERCLRAKLDGDTYYLFDLDEDGALTPGGYDGLALAEGPFVVPLTEALLTSKAQYALSVSNKSLHLTQERLELSGTLLREAAFVNLLRFRGARAPLVIDAQASRDAALHLEYLQDDGFLSGEVTIAIHDEDPAHERHTSSGARAGRLSLIGFSGSFHTDVETWYASVYHGVRLLDPGLRRMGVAHKFGISILYPLEDVTRVQRILVHPSDGAREIPLLFTENGEIPNPVPDLTNGRGAGFPVLAVLPPKLQQARLHCFELRNEEGRLVDGLTSTPLQPANSLLPTNLDSAFFIPRTTLVGATRYTARLQLEGMQQALEWSFTTTGSRTR